MAEKPTATEKLAGVLEVRDVQYPDGTSATDVQIVHKSDKTIEDLRQWYESYVEEKREQNKRAIRDRLYYDGIQWTDYEKKELERRNQPMVTINRIHPKINYILGREVRTRVDPVARPITPGHQDSAPAATDALRNVEENTKYDGTHSQCSEDLFIYGCTAVVTGIEDDDGRDIFSKRVPWRQIFYDPKSLESDFSDAKFRGIANWWDFDDLLSDPYYGQFKEILEQSVAYSTVGVDYDDVNQDAPNMWADCKRKRVKIIETYWTERTKSGEKVDLVCHYAAGGLLGEPRVVECRTDKGKTFCPMKMASCFVVQEGEDAGERYGIVRNMVSPQDEINHRRSKMLHMLNVYGAVYERSAIPDVNKFLVEISKPDCAAVVQDGAIAEGRIQLREGTALAQGQLHLLQEAKAEIDATGPAAPVVAGDQSVLSGRAILAKESIGSMELERAFDNLRVLQKSVYSSWWYLIRQNWTEEKWLRVRDSQAKEGYRFVRINRRMTRGERFVELLQQDVPPQSAIMQVGLPHFVAQQIIQGAMQGAQQQLQQTAAMLQQNGQQVPQQKLMQAAQQTMINNVLQAPPMRQAFVINDIAQLDVDIAIDIVQDTSIAAQEEFSELMQLAQSGVFNSPTPLLKALIKNSDLRDKQSILDALEQDPQQEQFQQQQMALQLQALQAQVQNLAANAQFMAAKAQGEQAKTAKTAIETQILPQEKGSEIQENQAHAMKLVSDAGTKSIPTPSGLGG